MNEENERDQEWVDELLQRLPAPQPVPDDVSRHLDQFLAERVAELQAQSNVVSFNSAKTQRTFGRRYQFMVAAAAITGVLVFVGTQNSFFTGNSNQSQVASKGETPSKQPEANSDSKVQEEANSTELPSSGESTASPAENNPEPQPAGDSGSSEMVDPEASTTEIQVLGSEGGTQYLPTDAPDVQITKSGLDYATQFKAILNKVAPYGEAGKVNKLNKSQLNCIVQLKLVDRVIAVDSGTYKAKEVVTFFAFKDDGTTVAYVTIPSGNCELVKKIAIN